MNGATQDNAALERILVAIKPRQRGLPLAAQHARLLADGCAAKLLLVSAVFDGRVEAALERGDATAARAQARIINAERAELERLAGSLRDWGADVATRVAWEAPAYAGILRVAREWGADLVVVGAHKHQLALQTRLKETDWQLMRRCPCPLLLVKDPAFDGYRRVVAAIDPALAHAEPSGLDDAVLSTAARVARLFESELTAVHAYADPAALGLVPAVQVAPGEYLDAAQWPELHRAAAEAVASRYGVSAARVVVAAGDPVDVIVTTARSMRAELIVVGTARRTALEQALLGSTAEAVAAGVTCDVLLVPPPEAGANASKQRSAAGA